MAELLGLKAINDDYKKINSDFRKADRHYKESIEKYKDYKDNNLKTDTGLENNINETLKDYNQLFEWIKK